LTFDQQVTFLYTADLARTAAFYENVLGLPLVLDQGACRIYRVAAGAFVGFCQRAESLQESYPSGSVRPTGVILTLVTYDVDEWYEQLRAQGVPFEQAPALNPRFNIYHCFLRDPSGYLIEIQRFLDPGWPRPPSRG
jgi:catechol 2,3-dioxygenase-like lactoylglutathione lyase family enzyme